MDKSEYPSLPNLAQLHARLAANNRRVASVVDAQLDGIERLFSAATAEDWEGVAAATRYLANQNDERIGGDIVRQAKELCEELKRSQPRAKPPKNLAGLLTACRAAVSR